MIVPNIRKPKLHFKSKTAFYRAQLRFTSALAMCMNGQHMTDTEIEVLALLLAAPNPTGDPFSTYNRKQVRDKLGMNNQAMSNHLGMLYKKGYLARSKGAYFLAAFLNLDLDADLVMHIRLVKPNDSSTQDTQIQSHNIERNNQEVNSRVLRNSTTQRDSSGVQSGRDNGNPNNNVSTNQTNDGKGISRTTETKTSGMLLDQWAGLQSDI